MSATAAARPLSRRRGQARTPWPAVPVDLAGPACEATGPGLFFGPDDERAEARRRRVAQAKAVCQACPVRVACLATARANQERYGVWGGVDMERIGRSPKATRPDAATSGRAS